MIRDSQTSISTSGHGFSRAHIPNSYIVGSGWFVAQGPSPAARVLLGDNVTRTGAMHLEWFNSIRSSLDPLLVYVVNSASQVESPLRGEDAIHWANLDTNYGHSTSHIGKYSGWMRAHFALSGLLLASDAEWLVYVEQDVLLYGHGFIEKEIQKSKLGIFFGSSENKSQPIQQSVYGIRRDAINKFNKRIEKIPFSDNQLSPESKFAWAASWLPIGILAKLWMISSPLLRAAAPKHINGDGLALYVTNLLAVKTRLFRYMDLQGGRDRPIDWQSNKFYITHCTEEELATYKGLIQK